ncbi:MAG: DNA recombination protein RmuC [Rikenellaceae bacterium]|nr:DNA recombination protein RmuC [Rikenellaceae bacterium]
MELFYAIIAVLALASIIFLVLWVRERSKTQKIGNELLTANTNLQNLESSFASQSERLVAQTEALNAERRAREAEQMARVKAETELAAEQRLMAEKMRSQEEVEQTMREQFKALAGDVLGEQSRRFKEENRESMDLILKPFKDNITEFRTRVESIFTHQNEQSGVLKNELQRLMELNVQITTETTNLTNALRGNSKVQGDWGEVILETILDNSNLIRGVHYQTQLNVKDEAGNNLRPDVVLYLPNNKQIVIDSKVSLTAYVNYVSAQTEAERRVAMAAHVASVRQHVKELSAKKYQQLMQSPDFVVMFVPNEPAFLDALKEDHSIWSDAYDKKVVVSSPTNLFALLKLVDDLWRRDDQNKNQENIIKFGVTLYEQLVAFTSALEGVGAGLDQARAKYDEAYKRLCKGNNNIVRVGEKLRKLGLPTSKRQSARLIDECCADEDNNLIENE